MNYEICEVPTYKVNYNNTNKIVKNIEIVKKVLMTDRQFHERLGKNDLLKLSVDIDKLAKHNPTATFEKIFSDICEYVGVEKNDISYTTNFSVETGSHHISIPKYFMKSSLQKVFWKTFQEKYGYGKEIDADIFDKEGWFRLPNQTKEGVKGTEHIIQKGDIEDFILKYVEKSTEYLLPDTIIEMTTEKNKKNKKHIVIDEDDDHTDVEYYDEINVKEGLDEVKKCLECVKVFCESGYEPDWSKIGQILKNEYKNEGERYFVDWTFEYGSENKKKECSNHYKNNLKYTPKTDKNRISIKTLHFLAKQKNSKLYLKYFPPLKLDDTFQYIDEILENITDYSLANYWVKYFGNKYKCIDTVKNVFYEFNENNLWNRNEGGTPIRLSITKDLKIDFKKYQEYLKNEVDKNISNEQKELINKKLVTVKDILTKIEKTNDKRNILSEIKDLIYDEEFDKDMNKELYVLPLKNNKMINIKTLELTDRSINNKFNYMCDVEYVEMTKEQEDDIKEYFMSLFCDREDTMMVVLNILKSIFAGLPLKYIFFFTGSGNNGKSLLFEFLKAIFNKAIDTISKEVILDTKSNNSITTQFEKLDKVRVGYVTETKEEDILNDIVIKAITGGDAMDCRKLFKTNETITPTCNLCVLTNKLPKFNVEPAILQRIIICPMNNTFEVDNTFKTKMLEKKNLLFSFIMKYGKVLDKFELTDEMINSKNEYKDDNVSDCLGDFIKEKCDIVEFVKTERIESKNFILEYKNWLLLNRLKDKNMDKKATYYTKHLKKIFKIESQESNSKTYYKGIIWKSDEEDEEIKDTEK